ncbi:hypothetical protein L1O48_05475 [Ligilactobacillus equi]|uniref:hypothetical protein n=1 Tax=Ligilactobacillus equi TaxID=137357 RepID=UPI002ED5A3DC
MKNKYFKAINYQSPPNADARLVLPIQIGIILFGLATTMLTFKFGFAIKQMMILTVALAIVLAIKALVGRIIPSPEAILALDQSQQGLWLWSNRRQVQLFIPFEFLKKLIQSENQVTFVYRRAYYFNNDGQPKLSFSGCESFNASDFDQNAWKNFFESYNNLVKDELQYHVPMNTTKAKKSSTKGKISVFTWPLVTFVVISFLANIVYDYRQNAPRPKAGVELERTVVYRPGMKITTKQNKFTILGAYRAKSETGANVLIVHIKRQQRNINKEAQSLRSHDFVLASSKWKAQNYGGEEPLSRLIVKAQGRKYTVVNLLKASGEELVSASLAGKYRTTTFNVAFKIPSKGNKYLYFTYLPFTNNDAKYSDTPVVFVRVNLDKLGGIPQ